MSKFRLRPADTLDYGVYLIYRGAAWLLGCWPVPWVFRFGQAIGWFGHLLLGAYRRLARRNIKIAFPDWPREEVNRCAKQHFMDLVANLLCAFALVEKPWEQVKKYLDTTNFDNALERINGARSVLWTINHIGNWELFIFCAVLVRPGRHGVIYRALPNRFIDEHIRKARTRTGLEMIERKHGLSQSTRILKDGGMLAILVDQHAGDKGIWTPFFKRLASTSHLPAILAAKTGAELLPVAIFTVGPGKWRLEVGEFVPQEGGSIEEVTYRINRALESLIVKRPSDWFWVHQRWKTPSPKFLLRDYKRGVYLPADRGSLSPFRILVRSTNWLGDAVMSAEAVRRIKRGRPDVRLSILTRAKLADFWQLVPEVDEVITIEPGDSVFRVASKIGTGFDVAVLFPNSVRSAIEVWLAGIPRRVGYAGRWRRAFLNQIIPEPSAPGPLRHQTGHYLRVAHRAGAEMAESLQLPKRQSPEPLLAGLCPGAEYGPAKRWTEFGPASIELSRRHGLHWLIFGTAKEKRIGDELIKTLGSRATDLTGRTSLAELVAQIQRCHVLLTNDTGTMHLASFLGVPTVAIFGSTEPALTGPLGRGHIVIRHHVECSPCFLRECPLDFRCMKAVTVDEVVSAVEQVLEREDGRLAQLNSVT
ncbi:MAG TPA: lipopolysaccharide heptosyltransferase II [Chthoniobacterales bacterium]|nr:lipopolysaccharide heptosyltransferase II [Chthoniobacterales bacterium]